MNKRVVITGIGIVASNALGKDDFARALRAGRSGLRPVTLFDTARLSTKLAGEIAAFDAEAILGAKGLRTLDRTTKLTLAASKMALDDARIPYPIPEKETDRYGVALGSTLGSVWSTSEFDKESLRDGPRSVNPALFPNTVINSPASHASIRFNIQGFSATVSTGFCAGLDALQYAAQMIRLYDYRVVLAGGVEELCEQTYKGFHKIGHLAGSRQGKAEVNCPFDRRRNGIVFGEGSALLVLEDRDHARARGASVYAEVLGYGAAFDPDSHNVYNPRATGASQAIGACLRDAAVSADEIDYIAASANSTLDCDAMETMAVKRVFNARAPRVPVSAVKSMTGECFSASGALCAAAAATAIDGGFVPPTIHFEVPDRRCDLDYVRNAAREAKVTTALVNAFSPTGAHVSICLGRER